MVLGPNAPRLSAFPLSTISQDCRNCRFCHHGCLEWKDPRAVAFSAHVSVIANPSWLRWPLHPSGAGLGWVEAAGIAAGREGDFHDAFGMEGFGIAFSQLGFRDENCCAQVPPRLQMRLPALWVLNCRRVACVDLHMHVHISLIVSFTFLG